MSGLEAITKRLPALESTQQKYTSASVQALGQLEEEIDRIVQLRAEGAADASVDRARLDAASKRLTDHFKEYHAQISKFSKELDKVLDNTGVYFDARLPVGVAAGPDEAVRRLLAQYLCHKAFPRAAHSLMNGEGMTGEYSSKHSSSERTGGIALSPGAEVFLSEMPVVVQGLRRGDVRPSEQWVLEHRMQLGRRVIFDLTFEIARIRYLQILQRPFSAAVLREALRFVERRLSVFHGQYAAELRPLLVLLLTLGQPDPSPPDRCSHDMEPVTPPTSPIRRDGPGATAVLSVEAYMSQLGKAIFFHCSKINDLPGDGHCSNFEVLLNTGKAAHGVVSTALQFVKTTDTEDGAHVGSVKRQKTLSDLEASGLPVDFKIKPEHRFHSVFCCPVSKLPATEGDPPVLLSCGHAILMSSMKSLPRRSNKFKCPTCYGPSEESMVVPLKIY